MTRRTVWWGTVMSLLLLIATVVAVVGMIELHQTRGALERVHDKADTMQTQIEDLTTYALLLEEQRDEARDERDSLETDLEVLQGQYDVLIGWTRDRLAEYAAENEALRDEIALLKSDLPFDAGLEAIWQQYLIEWTKRQQCERREAANA